MNGSRLVASAALILLGLASCKCAKPNYEQPLPPGARALLPLGPNDVVPDFAQQWNERGEILPALDRSLEWTRKKVAPRYFPIEGITHERALASLERMRELLQNSKSSSEFGRKVRDEFVVYKSAGWDAKGGGVLFTGYCTPILPGSRERTAECRYPLYALPPDLVKGEQGEILGRRTASGALEPYPTRAAIEKGSLLANQGLELVWLRDPIDAFIAHVNGSAVVRLSDDQLVRLGYAGKNGRPYSSLGKALVADGQLKSDEVSLAKIRQWAQAHPERVPEYLGKNESYVFFTAIDGNPRGSLNVEVTGGRTLATDKTLFPRGAIVYVDTQLSVGKHVRPYERFLFDQDTGGAIRTAGRADIYLGVGDEAEALAGSTRSEGQLYYLFLRESVAQP